MAVMGGEAAGRDFYGGNMGKDKWESKRGEKGFWTGKKGIGQTMIDAFSGLVPGSRQGGYFCYLLPFHWSEANPPSKRDTMYANRGLCIVLAHCQSFTISST